MKFFQERETLQQQVSELTERNEALERENAALKKRVAELEVPFHLSRTADEPRTTQVFALPGEPRRKRVAVASAGACLCVFLLMFALQPLDRLAIY